MSEKKRKKRKSKRSDLGLRSQFEKKKSLLIESCMIPKSNEIIRVTCGQYSYREDKAMLSESESTYDKRKSQGMRSIT